VFFDRDDRTPISSEEERGAEPGKPQTEEIPVTETLRNRATSRRLIPLIAATIALSVGAGAAHAQSISNLSIVKNGTNSADEVQTSNPRYQRRSTVQVLSSSASSFDTRYGFLVAADYDGFQIFGNSRTESLTVSYTISFQVTAPGAY